MRPLPQLREQQLPVEVMTLTHAEILETRSRPWPDEAACAAHAAALAARPALRDATIELRGALGAGKTTFVRHLLHALGVPGRIKSPSYTVLEPYELPGFAISHFDFYRFDDAREWEDAGLREIFAAPGLKLVEWPQKAEALLPAPDLRLQIDIAGEHARQVTLQALTPRGRELLR
ncbi:MAG TPA: tRNA (adenosine(37)-N6)-threonylcarbamoyltransferase complex ATPase subunit type 1 TsaE [Rubrivivax sp.]|nr:tRNA (adenosine(37)-N6)-threonylcarbamoyltransferase complex ATPase subunit type 1 TsaE [Rubrivivax sp.]